ncbi:MAG: ribokinase [Chloroflexota bacterium]
MSGRVIVVGSVNVDLVVNAARLPSPGETVTGGTFARHDGGKGGNQAVAAARLGASVVFVGAVGDDDLGERARGALEESGVDVSALATVPGVATGVALIVVAAGGENQIAVASGANEHVTPERVRDALARLAPGRGDVLLCVHEIPTAAVREALRLGRAAGARTILNPAPAGGLDRSVFGGATVVTPNRHELAALVEAEARWTGRAAATDTERSARTLIEASPEGPGAEAVVVTLGAMGALIVERGRSLEIAAPRVSAVDTVGAGDALNGALAAAFAEGRLIDEAVRRAVVAASLSTLRAGAREGMPTTADLERALANP